MNMADKWEDITLMNSKCSDRSVETHSQIYRAVLKNLTEKQCPQHHQEYEFYYHSQLLCHQCFLNVLSNAGKAVSSVQRKKYEYYYHLETILNHPIVLVIGEDQLNQQPIELMELTLNSYKAIYHKKQDFKVQKVLIDSFISKIKNRINELCDQISKSFEQAQQFLCKQSVVKENLKNLGMMYEEQMMDMLGEKFVQGRKEELQNILREYSRSNENPLPQILQNLEQMMACFNKAPFIDTDALSALYTTVTDEKLWKPNKIISTLQDLNNPKNETAELLLDVENVKLQNYYTLTLSDKELSLAAEDKVLQKLDIQLDSLYHLPPYRVLGVNYNQIVVINYFDCLKIEKTYSITGCTDVLPFEGFLVVVTNDELVVVDRATKKMRPLAKNHRNLKYCGQDPFSFVSENQYEQTIKWTVSHHCSSISASN